MRKKGKIVNYVSGFLRMALVALLVALQVALILLVTFLLKKYSIYVTLTAQITAYAFAIWLLNDFGSPSYRISWTVVIIVLPVSGIIMYLLWGKSSKRKIEKNIVGKLNEGFEFVQKDLNKTEEFEKLYPNKAKMSKYMESFNYPAYPDNDIKYFPMGEDVFEDILEQMRQAKHYIMVSFFIVADGNLWEDIHEIFKKKAAEGVEIMLLYDDFGAILRTNNKKFQKMLSDENIHVRVFNPIHKYAAKLYMNHRNHHKIVVIDGRYGYTGGMNIADEYINAIERFGVWKDNAVRIEGPAVFGLATTFLQMWNTCKGEDIHDYEKYRFTDFQNKGKNYCHIISGGPAFSPENLLEIIYTQVIAHSNRYLYITTPYLALEQDMKEALIAAKQSGVDVRIITPKIPDKKAVFLITRYNYGSLLEAGIRIYEYTPGFIHAKTIITDECGIIGSINMDYRSFYLHYEVGAFMYGEELMNTIKEDLLLTMEKSDEITYERYLDRPLWMKLIQPILNLFATLA